MIIRTEQLKTLANDVRQRFEGEMLVHLRGFSPRHCRVIGDDGVREVIRLGLERAGNYRFSKRGPVRYFIELMFNLGSGFDTDPQFPWAADALHDMSVTDEIDRAEILFDLAALYFRNTAGENNRYAVEALRRFRISLLDAPRRAGANEEELISLLRTLYPEKFEYVGEAVYRNAISSAFQMSEAYSCGGHEGKFLFVLASFATGHQFATDPLFPWIRSTLTDPRIVDPEQRVRRLKSKMQTYLDSVLEHVGNQLPGVMPDARDADGDS
jgi:hypothetical protein